MKDKILKSIKWLRSRTMVEKVVIHLSLTLIFSWIMYGNGFLTKTELPRLPGGLGYGEIETVFLPDGFLSIGVFALIMIFIIFGGKKDN